MGRDLPRIPTPVPELPDLNHVAQIGVRADFRKSPREIQSDSQNPSGRFRTSRLDSRHDIEKRHGLEYPQNPHREKADDPSVGFSLASLGHTLLWRDRRNRGWYEKHL